MPEDEPFRGILLVGCSTIVPVAFYFRIRSFTREKLDRKQEGLFILIALRVLGLLGFASLILYLVKPEAMRWAGMPLPNSIRWSGVILGCLTTCLLVWTFRSLGRNLTDTVVTRTDHTLVTDGPYRWVRHPFYTCAALAILTVSAVSSCFVFLVIGCAAFLLLVLRTRKEEENLILRFGDAYKSYMKRTGRFLPFF